MKPLLKLTILIFLISTLSLNATAESCIECEELVNKISGDVMSPFCPGRTLSACPSSQATDLRSEIQTWVKGGMNEVQVRQKLVDDFGSQVQGANYSGNFAILLWLTPVFILLLGSAFVFRYLSKINVQEDSDFSDEDASNVEAKILSSLK